LARAQREEAAMKWALAAIVLATAAFASPALAQSQLMQPNRCDVHARAVLACGARVLSLGGFHQDPIFKRTRC